MEFKRVRFRSDIERPERRSSVVIGVENGGAFVDLSHHTSERAARTDFDEDVHAEFSRLLHRIHKSDRVKNLLAEDLPYIRTVKFPTCDSRDHAMPGRDELNRAQRLAPHRRSG